MHRVSAAMRANKEYQYKLYQLCLGAARMHNSFGLFVLSSVLFGLCAKSIFELEIGPVRNLVGAEFPSCPGTFVFTPFDRLIGGDAGFAIMVA